MDRDPRQVTCDACWDRDRPPPYEQNDTDVKTLPCPKLRLQAVKMCSLFAVFVVDKLFKHRCQSEVLISEKEICSL